jgi:hypothetical protein
MYKSHERIDLLATAVLEAHLNCCLDDGVGHSLCQAV